MATKHTDSVSGRLAALKAIRDRVDSHEGQALLRQSLADRSNFVVERAAEIAKEGDAKVLIPDLVAAFTRLSVDPVSVDPTCRGKTAISKTLVGLEYEDAEFYRRGVEYEQHEPVWGDKKDTAAGLRAICAFGLILCVPEVEVLNRCARLLTDRCPEARVGAVQAIRILALPHGGALLRLKILSGDSNPEVLGECCAALLELEGASNLDFVTQMLESPDRILCVQAAFALGASRQAATFGPIRQAWERQTVDDTRQDLLICLGLIRSPEAIEFLLSLIRSDDISDAVHAVKALNILKDIKDLKQRVREAVQANGAPQLAVVFRNEWERERVKSNI